MGSFNRPFFFFTCWIVASYLGENRDDAEQIELHRASEERRDDGRRPWDWGTYRMMDGRQRRIEARTVPYIEEELA